MRQSDFDAFYEFAYPRVYRFASRRIASNRAEVDEAARAVTDSSEADEVRALCRLILERAFTAGVRDGCLRFGRDGIEAGGSAHGSRNAPANAHSIGFWLYAIAKDTADEFESSHLGTGRRIA